MEFHGAVGTADAEVPIIIVEFEGTEGTTDGDPDGELVAELVKEVGNPLLPGTVAVMFIDDIGTTELGLEEDSAGGAVDDSGSVSDLRNPLLPMPGTVPLAEEEGVMLELTGVDMIGVIVGNTVTVTVASPLVTVPTTVANL